MSVDPMLINISSVHYDLSNCMMAEQHPDIVVGVFSQQKLLGNTGQLRLTPGVHHVIHHSIMLTTGHQE